MSGRTVGVVLIMLLCGSAFGQQLDRDQFDRIVARPHGEEPLRGEMAVFSKPGAYRVVVRREGADGQSGRWVVRANDKHVEGRYIVTDIILDEAGDVVIKMVVYYDSEQKVFRKYVLAPDGSYHATIGTRVGDARSLAWGSTSSDAKAGRNLSIEHYTDVKVTWTEVSYKGAQVQYIEHGEATLIDGG